MIPKTIWVLWFQGIDKAPYVVSKCVQSWEFHNPGWEIIHLNEKNLNDYVDVSQYSALSLQALSDIVRLELLCKYGGVEGVNLPFTDFKYNTIIGFDVSKQTENLARSGNTIEVIATIGAGAGGQTRLHTCVLSEKQFIMSYTGGNPQITML